MAARPVALVTGAAKRIGRAIALDLAGNGYAVAVHASRSREEAERLAADIRDGGGQAHAAYADLTDRAAVARLLPETEAALGPVRLLVNNASAFAPDDATRFDAETFDRHFAVHVTAPAILAEQFAAGIARHGGEGLIVNIIDQRVWRLTPRFFSYTLSKSAMWTMTQTLAQSLAPAIRVNAIGPGPTLANERQAPEDFQAQVDAVPLKRAPDLAEFGRTIRYLHDTRSITGQMIALDGGQHLAWETPDVLNANE